MMAGAWLTSRMLIERPWGISAYGHGTVDTDPDHAVLRLAVNRLDKKPDRALQATAGTVTAVRGVLRHHEIPDTAVTSSRTSIHSVWNGFGADRTFQGHQCRAEFSVRVSRLDLVEQVVVDLVAAGADEIIGVDYGTSRTTELRAEARTQAVAAAQAKAQLYAEAAGVALGPVVHIEDVDPDQGTALLYRSAAAGAPQAESGSTDFAPGQLTVTASVAMGFSITH